MRCKNLIDRKESLPVNGVVVSHQPKGIPSGQSGVTPSLTGRDSFQSMRCNNLINRKGFLPVNEAVVSSGHLGATPKSPQE
jgi:hypothetical protein